MSEAKGVSSPVAVSNESQDESSEDVKFLYSESVGSLPHLSSRTRPCLAFAVNFEARSNENPTNKDVTNVKRSLTYLKNVMNQGLFYEKGGIICELNIYSDSDYAADEKTRKSTSGYNCFFNNGSIACFALSSTEAEFFAAVEAIKEIVYLKHVIKKLTEAPLKINLFMDNASGISLIKNGKFNTKSKHEHKIPFHSRKV